MAQRQIEAEHVVIHRRPGRYVGPEHTLQGHVWRSTDGDVSWALRPFPAGVYQRTGNEAAFIETGAASCAATATGESR